MQGRRRGDVGGLEGELNCCAGGLSVWKKPLNERVGICTSKCFLRRGGASDPRHRRDFRQAERLVRE